MTAKCYFLSFYEPFFKFCIDFSIKSYTNCVYLYKIYITMGRKRKLTTNEIIESINNTAPKIIFYTDKISIRLKNLDSIAFWKDKFPEGKVRYC